MDSAMMRLTITCSVSGKVTPLVTPVSRAASANTIRMTGFGITSGKRPNLIGLQTTCRVKLNNDHVILIFPLAAYDLTGLTPRLSVLRFSHGSLSRVFSPQAGRKRNASRACIVDSTAAPFCITGTRLYYYFPQTKHSLLFLQRNFFTT
jgi:hypothetical protein